MPRGCEGTAIAAAVRDLLAAPPARANVLRGAAPFSWEANAAALVEHWRRLVSDTPAGQH